MANNLTTANSLLQTEDSEYVRLVSLISGLWDKAKENAVLAVNGPFNGADDSRWVRLYKKWYGVKYHDYSEIVKGKYYKGRT